MNKICPVHTACCLALSCSVAYSVQSGSQAGEFSEFSCFESDLHCLLILWFAMLSFSFQYKIVGYQAVS